MLFQTILLCFLPAIAGWRPYVPVCPDGWGFWGGKCYQHVRKSVDWYTAEKACVDKGAHLASVLIEAENEFIKDAFDGINGTAWFGQFSDEKGERFIDGNDVKWWPTGREAKLHRKPIDEAQCGLLTYTTQNEKLMWGFHGCLVAGAADGYICKKTATYRRPEFPERCPKCPIVDCPDVQHHVVPEGFKPYSDNTFFKVFHGESNFLDAKKKCEENGAQLATFHSQKQQDFVYKMLNTDAKDLDVEGYWIGVKFDREHAGKARLAYNIDKTLLTFTAWRVGEPNDKVDEYCVRLYRIENDKNGYDNKWNDRTCDSTARGFVCKIKFSF